MNELIIKEISDNYPTELSREHSLMISKIDEKYPEIVKHTSMFNKRQSQFMDNILTVNHPTPIRNIRQILSEITRSKEALIESHYSNKEKEIEIKMLKRDLETEKDDLKKELIVNNINKKSSQLESSKGYISGAIRKITNHIEQMDSIMRSLNIEDFNEIDFEKEEERYHIMTAFNQAITAARARPDMKIDEGNHIYLNQLGINGSVAELEVQGLLMLEKSMIKDSVEKKNPLLMPNHSIVDNFLKQMAEKYMGCANRMASTRGMTTFTQYAALTEGDKRLLLEGK